MFSKLCLIFVAVVLALMASSCVSTQAEQFSGITGSDEEFRLKYPDLDYRYFNDVVEVETLAAKGKNIYDKYYRLKDNENKIDDEIRRRAVEIFSRAVNASMRIYKDTGAYSVLRIQRDVSTYMQDLLREYEKPGQAPAPEQPR